MAHDLSGAAVSGDASRGHPGVADEGNEPDARFTFANERTFLAWSRTALALVVAGLAVVQLLPPFPGMPWGRHIIGTPLILLGCAISVVSYLDWKGNQRALRRGEPLNRSRLPYLLAVTVAAIGFVAAVLALVSAVSRH
jgi:putative membrane protein